MEIGMVGLGRMGANMAERLVRGGHRVVGYDPNAQAVENAGKEGVTPAGSPESLCAALQAPRAVWLMVPAGDPVDSTIAALLPHLQPGDIVVDGGNSNYKDSIRRSRALEQTGIQFVDVGTSGGVWGLREGYSMMVGGDATAIERLAPALRTLAPAPDKGWGHVGPIGAGHFVKMVHNGIEYGLMQAYAEGFAIMRRKEEMGLDLHQISEIWQHGSVVRSWLLDLTASALKQDQNLQDVAPYVDDSGEGRWTVFEAIDLDVTTPVIALSLMQRFRSRDEESYADRFLATLRNQFGGHAIKREGQ